MSQRVIRMTNESFENMIAESVLKTLNEGFWGALGKGLWNVAKYAKRRTWDGYGEHDISEDPKNSLQLRIQQHYKKNPNMSKDQYEAIEKNQPVSYGSNDSNGGSGDNPSESTKSSEGE